MSNTEMLQKVNGNGANVENNEAQVINPLKEKVMEKRILTTGELAQLGKKVARLSGNRNFSPKAIKEKKASLLENGLLVPAIIVEAKDAIEAGLDVVDFETGEAVTAENAVRYVVLVDANHRFRAHKELLEEAAKGEVDYNRDFYFAYSLQSDVTIQKTLTEINIVTNPWKGADFGRGAKLMLKDNELPLLDAINDLTSNGYSLDSASKWMTFNNKITATIMAKAMNNVVDDRLKQTNGIERGKKLLGAAKQSFGEKFLGSRTLIDWIIRKYNDLLDEQKGGFTDEMVEFLTISFNRASAEEIEKTKGKRGECTKEDLIIKKLNKAWEDFKSQMVE